MRETKYLDLQIFISIKYKIVDETSLHFALVFFIPQLNQSALNNFKCMIKI